MINKEKQRELEWNKDEIEVGKKNNRSPIIILQLYLITFVIYVYERLFSYLENSNQKYADISQIILLLSFIILIYFTFIRKSFGKILNYEDEDLRDENFKNFSIDKTTEKSENKELISYCKMCNKDICKGDKFIRISNKFRFFSKWDSSHNSLFCKNCIKYEIYEGKRSFKEDVLRVLDFCTFVIPVQLLYRFIFKIKREKFNIGNQAHLNQFAFFGIYFFLVWGFLDNYKYDFVE